MVLMVLSDEQIEKYRRIHKSYFGKGITKEHAYEQGIKLVRLLSIIYKPMTEEEFESIQKRRNATTNAVPLHPKQPLV